jgi:ribokinase
MTRARVLVLGALHHDVVVDAPRLPREDETLRGSGVDYRFGGKGGNQAVAAARMGADVSMLGRIGADAAGRDMLEVLRAAGVDTGGVLTGQAASGMSVAITLPGGGYGAVIVSGANLENDGALPALAERAVVVLQNEVPPEANRRCAAMLRDDDLLIWNAAPAGPPDAALEARCDLLIVNRVEAGDMSGCETPQAAAEALFARVHADVIVTLGAEGALLRNAAGLSHNPAEAVDVVSTHGAGDMFTGALAARLAEGDGVAEALAFAQRAAGLFVSSAVAERHLVTAEAILP